MAKYSQFISVNRKFSNKNNYTMCSRCHEVQVDHFHIHLSDTLSWSISVVQKLMMWFVFKIRKSYSIQFPSCISVYLISSHFAQSLRRSVRLLPFIPGNRLQPLHPKWLADQMLSRFALLFYVRNHIYSLSVTRAFYLECIVTLNMVNWFKENKQIYSHSLSYLNLIPQKRTDFQWRYSTCSLSDTGNIILADALAT